MILIAAAAIFAIPLAACVGLALWFATATPTCGVSRSELFTRDRYLDVAYDELECPRPAPTATPQLQPQPAYMSRDEALQVIKSQGVYPVEPTHQDEPVPTR
jgi:hypothetical protein